MPRYYPVKDLAGGHVYDLYGLYFGEICGYEYYMDRIRFRICISYSAKTTAPDIERLKEMIARRNVEVRGDEPLEYLIRIARELRVDIPYKTVDHMVRILKAYIDVDEIIQIDRYIYDGKPRIIVLLNKPREALFRGWSREVEPKETYLSKEIIGKHVVSISNGYIGVVKDIVVGPGDMGVRVEYVKISEIYIAWLRFLNDLRRRGDLKTYNLLASIRDPLKHRRISIEEYDKLVEELKRRGVGENIIKQIKEYIEYSSMPGGATDISYRRIMYVNDIVVTY